MAYDAKCWDLAKVFIGDFSDAAIGKRSREQLTHELAQRIQEAIEDYIEAELS